MSNYPHIKNNVLLALENCNLTYLDESDGGCSLVVRLAPTKDLPLRFEKQGRVINERIDDQVSHEEQVFREIKNKKQSGTDIKKVFNRIEYIQRNDNYVLITKDTGVDVDIWQNISLYLRHNKRSYQNIFCHPLVLLHFIKGTLLAFQNIHQVGLYHCDIKGDQICIPFIKDGNMIVVNPDDVSLIDFGVAIWEMTPVASRNPVRFTSQNMKNGDYVATTLINAGDYQAHLHETTGKYDFNQLINQIDCAVDLYSFGFLLHSLEITQYPEDRQAWRSFFNKYQEWIDELLALSDQKTPFKNNLPHKRYIKQIDSWIGGVNEALGIAINHLIFEIKENNRGSTPPVRSRPTPTPTPINNVREVSYTPPVTPPVIQQDNNAQDKQMWQTASTKDTIDSYEEYVSVFPDGLYLREAYERLIALREEKRFFDKCCRENTTESYATYLIKYPNGKYVTRVNDRISNIKKREIVKQSQNSSSSHIKNTDQKSNIQSQNDEIELWNTISEKDEIAGYEEYLKKYPKGMYIKTANDKILEISENVFWQTVCQKGEISDYENYIKEFPNGKFIGNAQEAIVFLEHEIADFNECCKINTLDSCYDYLKKYPNGKYVENIKHQINQIENSQKQSLKEKIQRFDLNSIKNNLKSTIQESMPYVLVFLVLSVVLWENGYFNKFFKNESRSELNSDTNIKQVHSEINNKILIPFSSKGKMGFIDKETGNIAIEAQYCPIQSRPFFDGLAKVCKGDKYGFIDKAGRIVINIEYDAARDFSEGLVAVAKNGKWGFIDKTGRTVINFEYNFAESFSDGLAAIQKNGKWSYIDKTGEKVIDLESNKSINGIGNFSEGLSNIYITKPMGKYGFIDKTGRTTVDFKYDWASDFSEGLVYVEKNGKWGFIDQTGKTIIDFKYNKVKDGRSIMGIYRDYSQKYAVGYPLFRDGLAPVAKNGKFGFIDKVGRTVINFEYDEVSNFSNGIAIIQKDKKYGVITKSLKRTNIDFDYAQIVSEGIVKLTKDGKVFYFDKDGQIKFVK